MAQDLAGLKCFVLESMRQTLVKNVDPTKFLPFLRSKFVLDGRESDTIKSCCSVSVQDGADKLVDVLCTKGAKGYDTFCDAIIHDKTQVFLLTALNTRLEMAKYIKKQQETEQQETERARLYQQQQQGHLQEGIGVRPYNPNPSAMGGANPHPSTMGGMASAHTTTCLDYMHPGPTPQPYQGRLPSRSPGSPTDQPSHASCPPGPPTDQYSQAHGTTASWSPSSPRPTDQPVLGPPCYQIPPGNQPVSGWNGMNAPWNGMETTQTELAEQTDDSPCGQQFS